MQNGHYIAKELNEKLEGIREAKFKEILAEIKRWNPEGNSIGNLTLMFEEIGSIPGIQRELTDSLDRTITKIKSASVYQPKINKLKQQLQRLGEGDLIICDRHGLCICSFDYGDPIARVRQGKCIVIVHISSLVESLQEFHDIGMLM